MFGYMSNIFFLGKTSQIYHCSISTYISDISLQTFMKDQETYRPFSHGPHMSIMRHKWLIYNRNDVCWQSMATDRSPCALCIFGTIFHRFGFEFPNGLLQQSLPFANPGLASKEGDTRAHANKSFCWLYMWEHWLDLSPILSQFSLGSRQARWLVCICIRGFWLKT